MYNLTALSALLLTARFFVSIPDPIPSTFGTSITALKMSENDRRVLWEIHKSTYNMKRPISLYLLPCMLH